MKRIAALALAGLILIGCAAVYASGGSASDPLVPLSYLTGTYIPGVVSQAETRVDSATGQTYQTALNDLNARHAAYSGEGSGSAALTDRRVKRGDCFTLSAGSGAVLLAGSASVTFSSGAVVDVTAGQSVPSGTSLTARHRYLAAEQTSAAVTITSDTAVICLEGTFLTTLSTEVDYNALADALKEMGMFKGGDLSYGSGYDLERAPTRIEGLIMFLRLLGEEQAALSHAGPCPFADVPAWCQGYVSYAYEQGYTKGVGTNASGTLVFGTNNTITAGEYVTFVLRALGYTDSGSAPDFAWNTALAKGMESGVLTAGEHKILTERPFLRAQVAYLSYFALSAQMKDGGGTLLDALAAGGGVDRAAVGAIMSGVTVARIS